jgi:hypothetical protein
MPELPQAQREALAFNVKTPLTYTNVVVRDWQPWLALKVSDITAPMGFFSHVALDFPVDLGGYRHPRDPAEPTVLHLEHVPGAANSGLDARAQFHIGQAKLLAMTFADFETRIRDELDRMLGPGGFDSERDIAAIPSTGGRTATDTWRIRCSIPMTMTIAFSPWRGGRLAVWRLPIPTPAATPMRIWPSTRRRARSESC